jgi:hypothetical protein
MNCCTADGAYFSPSAATAARPGATAARISYGGTKVWPLRCERRHLSGQKISANLDHDGINGGYDLDPRRLGGAGVSLLGRVLDINDGTLALADDVEKLLAAADDSYATFIEAADRLAATPEMRSEVDQTEVPAPLPPLRA